MKQRSHKPRRERDGNPEEGLRELVNTYYSATPYQRDPYKNHELEIRFFNKKGFNKIDYDNVIKRIQSLGYETPNPSGDYSLRISTDYTDVRTGFERQSDMRVEINSIFAIQQYCKTNNLMEMVKSTQQTYPISFIKKYAARDTNKIRFDDFGFQVSYSLEDKQSPTSKIVDDILPKWFDMKKTFRYLNRVSFHKRGSPIQVDISIIKTSSSDPSHKGRYMKNYNIQESNVFNNIETYEIELEVDNRKIGPGTDFTDVTSIIREIKKTVKHILSGLQNTNFPISYKEQKDALDEYINLLYGDNPPSYVDSRYFIGPSSFTLQLENVVPIDATSTVPNIRENFTVTEKADGLRHLCYISLSGKIYLIDTNMNVIFTGAVTPNKEVLQTLLDGELILNDKFGKFINMYAAFDIYYLDNKDVRALRFDTAEPEEGGEPTRYRLLINTIHSLDSRSVVNPEQKQIHINFQYKKFYSGGAAGADIFKACAKVLSMKDTYPYNIDGIIFTHMLFGVGGSQVGTAGKLRRETWAYSFKWKPPQYNTIDFLVETVKDTNKQDIIHNIFEGGTTAQIQQYKSLVLKCGFDEQRHGYINPCQDMLDGRLPEFIKNGVEGHGNTYRPMRFYPTTPYDVNAGLCNIMLKKDGGENMQMFSEDNEVFEDNTIVEFAYDGDKDGLWKWIPLRVRYDKTTELRRGISKNYGNDYATANGNWRSIHIPITIGMITTGAGIPETAMDDVYYKGSAGRGKDTSTRGLRDFHNLFVKRKLIYGSTKPGNTLIDYSCGKAGDLPKWIESKLSFVFGVDYSNDNITNRVDGACARYLNRAKDTRQLPKAIFLNGDSSENIRSGAAMKTPKSAQIAKALFGNMENVDRNVIGDGVSSIIGKFQDGFDVSSCQFSIHYFFENITKLHGFIRNVAECTKLNGLFVGDSYDGKNLFGKLRNLEKGESLMYALAAVDGGSSTKLCEIVKSYDNETFEDNDSCIGYRIDVYQESINQYIPEYLVNYDYYIQLMEMYGFVVVSHEEAKTMGFVQGTGMFQELFQMMIGEGTAAVAKKYGTAASMSKVEKEISFLNRYFIFRKVSEVDTEKVMNELLRKPFREAILDEGLETSRIIPTMATPFKPRVRRIGRKIKLIEATDAADAAEEGAAVPLAVAAPPKSILKKGVGEPKKTGKAKTLKFKSATAATEK